MSQPFVRTTTSTLEIPTRKLSLATMPSSQWPQPELSIGERHGSMDKFGIYKCWAIKDKSPAQQVWKSVSKAIVALLEDQFEHLDAKDKDLMVEMFMIGRKQATCNPTILFSCESKISRQRAMDLVQKKRILAAHPGVLIAECARLPRLLAADKSSSLDLSPGVYASGDLHHCGISVLIIESEGGSPRKATIGGIVCIGDDSYGLTANHPFSKASANDRTEEPDTEFAFYGLGDPEDDSSDDEVLSAEMTSQGSASSTLSQPQLGYDLSSSQDSPLVPGQEEVLADRGLVAEPSKSIEPDINQTQLPKQIGDFFVAPPQGEGLDWALVKMRNLSSTDQAINSMMIDIMTNTFVCANKQIRSTTIAPEPKDTRVLIGAGHNNAVIKGSLSALPSFQKLHGSSKFQELWTVSCADATFYDGDCGSWVVDYELGDLYGQIVSGYPDAQKAYIIPAVHIFREIEEFLGPVRLSTARPITTVEAQNSSKTKTGLAQIQSRDILADRTGSKARMAAELDSQSLDRLSNRSPKATSTEKDASLPPPPQEVVPFTRETAESFNSFDDQGTKSSLSPIATRDIYTGATPHLRSTTSFLPRSLSDSGFGSGMPILPTPIGGFTSPDTSIYGSFSNTPCPPLFTTEVHHSLQTSEGQLIKPEIFGKINKGFFMADNDWTCYRRNYFSLNCSYTLQPTIPNGAIYLVGQTGGAGAQVHSFAISIAAVVDGRDGKSIELVQHTPKRDKGPQDRPPRIILAPRPPASLDLYGGDSGLDGSKGNIYNTQGLDQTPNSPQIEATFERIQFKNSTANNGKRRSAQQYFHLLVELFADIGPQHTDRWVKIASRISAPLVVRGRSPGHYQGERRGSNTSTGPGGSGGTGSGGGAYTPGSASGTPGDITMSGTSSMLPGPGSGSGYDGHSHSNIAPLQIPWNPPSHLYSPGAIYKGHETRDRLPGVSGISSSEYTTSEAKSESVGGSGYVLPSLSDVDDREFSRHCGRWEGVPESKGDVPTLVAEGPMETT